MTEENNINKKAKSIGVRLDHDRSAILIEEANKARKGHSTLAREILEDWADAQANQAEEPAILETADHEYVTAHDVLPLMSNTQLINELQRRLASHSNSDTQLIAADSNPRRAGNQKRSG